MSRKSKPQEEHEEDGLPEDPEDLLIPERTERLLLTVGRAWREGRVSCPHRDLLRAFHRQSLSGGQASYIAWHVYEAECPYCMASLEELEAAGQDGSSPEDLDEIKQRLLSSTLTFLESRRC